MLFFLFLLALSSISAEAVPISASIDNALYPVHNIIRYAGIKFENLAVRSNGQILTTSTYPNASIYQVDPLGILPLTLIAHIPNVSSATGIVERKSDIFYVTSGDIDLDSPLSTVPTSYTVTEIDVRNVSVLPNGTLTQEPAMKRVASLPGAALLNGAALARPESDHLLIADSFRGLIWNVNVANGDVGVTLNDTTTKGPAKTGPLFTGINGIKVHNGTLYWTNTGASSMYKVAIDEQGNIHQGQAPSLVTSDLTCDDFLINSYGYAYVAGPLDVITRVSPTGEKEVIAGVFNSTASPLVGPTAVKFGRLVSDRWSLYITTNGGLAEVIPGAAGVSRIDLGLTST